MIGHLPLWLLVAIWYIQRRHSPRVNLLNYQRMTWLLQDVQSGMPVPGNRLEIWLMVQVANWIKREQDALAELAGLGVIAYGRIEK